jgi:hypothetical protein
VKNPDPLLTDLFRAYFDARRNKRNKRSALMFEWSYEHRLIELYDEIVERRYQPRPSICFIVNKPASKSLFHAGENKGLPIGNLTSQLFANFYLDDFDHFMKENLQLSYYGRYVDDMVVVHPDKNYLLMVIRYTSEYLIEKLSLTLHPKKIYLQPFSRGVQFVGAYIKPYRIYISNCTKGNFFEAIERQNVIARQHKPTREDILRFQSAMNSYLGILCHYRTYRLRKRMLFKNLSAWWCNHVYLRGGIAKFVRKGA